MKAEREFDVRLDAPLRRALEASVVFSRTPHPAELVPYEAKGTAEAARWARVRTTLPFDPKWGDEFQVEGGPEGGPASGVVLLPQSPDPKELRLNRRLALLRRLSGDEKEMTLGMAEAGGLEGVGEERLLEATRLGRSKVETLARDLEMEGRARILSFSPLLLVAQESLDFLADQVLAALERWHAAHPDRAGYPRDELREKTGAPARVFALTLKTLEKDARVKTEDGDVRLPGFVRTLTPQDKKILEELEALAFRGTIRTDSLQDLRRKYKIGPERLDSLLGVLAAERKVILGQDGFIVRADWLDGIVGKIRGRGVGSLLTVADFKEITGLSRKWSIPLLELLDEMGVTRRRGDSREVLPVPRSRR